MNISNEMKKDMKTLCEKVMSKDALSVIESAEGTSLSVYVEGYKYGETLPSYVVVDPFSEVFLAMLCPKFDALRVDNNMDVRDADKTVFLRLYAMGAFMGKAIKNDDDERRVRRHFMVYET